MWGQFPSAHRDSARFRPTTRHGRIVAVVFLVLCGAVTCWVLIWLHAFGQLVTSDLRHTPEWFDPSSTTVATRPYATSSHRASAKATSRTQRNATTTAKASAAATRRVPKTTGPYGYRDVIALGDGFTLMVQDAGLTGRGEVWVVLTMDNKDGTATQMVDFDQGFDVIDSKGVRGQRSDELPPEANGPIGGDAFAELLVGQSAVRTLAWETGLTPPVELHYRQPGTDEVLVVDLDPDRR